MTKSERYHLIDGLRGIAAIWVVAMHFQTLIKEKMAFSPPLFIDWLISHGEVGVSIFFVLSGFVIAYSLRNTRLTWGALGQFFLRRSLRLDPPYWAALALLMAFIYFGSFFFKKGSEFLPTSSDVILNVLYLQNIFDVPNILPVAWTLCLEIQFYLLLALFLKGAQAYNQLVGKDLFNYRGFSLLGPHLLFLPSLFFASQLDYELSIPGTCLPFWYSFYMGCLLGWVLTKSISEIYYLTALGGAFIFYLLGNNDQIAITALLSLGLFYCIKAHRLHGLNYTFLQYLGRISYSLYLLHWPIGIKLISLVIFLLPYHLVSPLGLLFISLAASIGAADLFYRLIERPCLSLSKGLSFKYARVKFTT